MTEIKTANTDDDIRRCYPAIRELRPHLTDAEDFLARVRRQREEGYRFKAVLGNFAPRMQN